MYFYRPYHQIMMPEPAFGFGNLIGILFWILLLGLLISLLVKMFSSKDKDDDENEEENDNEGASEKVKLLTILKRRYAKGEINSKEFEKMKKDLL